jgi:hypothetical protein
MRNVAASGNTMRLTEIGRCVDGWSSRKSERAAAYRALNHHLASDSEALLLEVGNSGWGYYQAAAVVDGALLIGPSGPDDTSRLPAKIPLPTEPCSRIDIAVDDGNCWFLTVVRNGRITRSVHYGAIDSTCEAGRAMTQLAPMLWKPR